MASTARGLIDLLRPELPFAAGICVVAGELLGLGRIPAVGETLLGFLVGFFISGSEMALNDYFDLVVDMVNHPERPLPSKRVSPREALVFASVFAVAGFVTSSLWSLTVLLLSVLVWVVAVLYNWRYKEAGILGNVMVGFSVAMTFVLGGVGATGLLNGLVLTFGACAFVFDLSEEISAGAMDVLGDEKRRVRSVARLRGRDFALRVSAALFALFVVLTSIPAALGWLGKAYLVMVAVTDVMVVTLAFLLVRSTTVKEGRLRIRQLYIGLTVFIVAVIASRLLFS
jgi:geranylgeranylglycerol-phosphate geranylgeranyltransferase